MTTLDLPADQLALVREALRRHIPGYKVIAFGSRTNGRARRFSDLDLCIMGEERSDEIAISNLKGELDEAPLPIRVDILDWATTSENFRAIILNQNHVVIQEGIE